MKLYSKILAMILAVLTALSVFAACGDGTSTTEPSDVTEPSVTNTPDSNESDTDVPDTNAPETDAPETLPVVVEPEPVAELLKLDFDTELSLADYIAATDGIAINGVLNGGSIVDGRWVYSGVPLAIKDELGIFELGHYSVEFDFCFNSFVNRDNSSVFSFIVDDDGVLNGDSSFYVPFKGNINGDIYHNSAAGVTFSLEAGKTYHYKADVDTVDGQMKVYIDDILLAAPTYNQNLRDYRCFRFMDNNRGADMWIDNFVITDTEALENASTDKIARAVDGAYTRGGKYADQVLGLAENVYIDMKYATNSPEYCREGFIKFDISKLVPGKVQYTVFNASFGVSKIDTLYDIYWVNSDWDSETITYNNMPLGKLIIKDAKFNTLGASFDLAPFISEALAKGDKFFSIRIVPTYQTTDSQVRMYFTGENKPSVTVYAEKPTNNYFENLVDDEVENKAIWDYAQQMYDEWYARYKALPAVNEDAVLLGRDESQYTKTNYASQQSTNYNSSKAAYKSRPFAALTDFEQYVSKEFKNAKLDKYGGIMIESLKQEATGFFRTEKIDGRWWLIDPLGYPYISIGLSDVHYSQLGSKLQKDNAIKLYGSYDAWALATTRQVREELYFNNSFRPVAEIIALDGGLAFGAPIGVMSNYGSTMGLLGDGNGSTIFLANNTMPVFDPSFVSYADNRLSTQIKYVGNDRLIGYMTDNELPMNSDMLDRAMTIDHTKASNHYTYACTWTWLCNMTGKKNPDASDITDELRDLYIGFVWDRYFYVVANAVKKYDPDHMYLGSRFLPAARNSEWLWRFAAQYVDCATINWYQQWEPDANALYRIEKNGDMPFIITEFYTKAGDSGLGNTSGAGWFVATQTDRADFYETFVIRLLETQSCVGWQWFQYMDNDPHSGTGDASSVDSNKGLYKSDFTLYTELADRMAVLNKNVYNIIDYFENKTVK